MTTAAEVHDARVAAYNEQRERLLNATGDRWSRAATRFHQDPRREPDATLRALLDEIRPDDSLLDVGGGAGRYALPLALHCREAVVVDPSAAMQREFEATVAEAGITNARFVAQDWLTADAIEGDLVLVAHVTYFVSDIRRFVERLVAATRRRAVILVNSMPPPNAGADLFGLAYGEPQALVPGYRELLPVLWEAGLLPEVRIIYQDDLPASRPFATRDEAIDSLTGQDLGPVRDRMQEVFGGHFEELFVEAPDGFRRRQQPDPRQLLITWDVR
jgi:cyclopropane fatty-acyl-phospholipid synthase-like methyltransferase